MSRASKTGVRGLYKGTDGRYRIDLRWKTADGTPKRHREQLPPKTSAVAAKARALAILNGALDGTFDPDREAPVTLRVAFDRYLDHCRAHGIASTRSRVTHAKQLCALIGEGRMLEAVTAADLERVKSEWLGSKSPATINRHLATMKQVARWASKVGLLDPGRAAELRDVGLLREPEGRVRWLSEAEQRTVDEHLAGWLRPIVLTALGTGARRTEVAGLRHEDVDREHGELVLRRTKNRKTRHVPMSPEVRAIIDAQPPGPPSSFVFHVPSRASRKPASERRRSEEERRGDVVTKAWAAWCAKHGLEDLRVHDLRHHAATMIRRAGHGLDVVAGVLGHSDVRVAARYAHVGRDELAAAVAAASRSIGGNRGSSAVGAGSAGSVPSSEAPEPQLASDASCDVAQPLPNAQPTKARKRV